MCNFESGPLFFSACQKVINKPSVGKSPVLPVQFPHAAAIQLGITGAHYSPPAASFLAWLLPK